MDSRIRYENGSVTRIDRCVFGLTKTHTFENALVWTGPYITYTVSITAKNAQHGTMLFGAGLNNVVLLTLFTVVNSIVQHCYTRLWADSDATVLFNILLTTVNNVGSKTLLNTVIQWALMLCCPHCSTVTVVNNIVQHCYT